MPSRVCSALGRRGAIMVRMNDVGKAYDALFGPVTQILGTTVDPLDPDRAVIERWAANVNGPILDLGSGTGRWTGHLASLGYDVEGIDPSERFVSLARRAHPGVRFRVAGVQDLAGSSDRWSGVLAWYSLIHHDAHGVRDALSTLRQVLDGSLLLSYFTGPRPEATSHPVATAHRWPTAVMSQMLAEAGFVTRNQHDQGVHAVITAETLPLHPRR